MLKQKSHKSTLDSWDTKFWLYLQWNVRSSVINNATLSCISSLAALRSQAPVSLILFLDLFICFLCMGVCFTYICKYTTWVRSAHGCQKSKSDPLGLEFGQIWVTKEMLEIESQFTAFFPSGREGPAALIITPTLFPTLSAILSLQTKFFQSHFFNIKPSVLSVFRMRQGKKWEAGWGASNMAEIIALKIQAD